MATPATAFPIADADKCVKCALCLPHCPTYRATLDEGESPRGRIALMQGMVSGALETTPKFAAHLDHCLACRACEAVCPAEVPYGKLIDAARLELRQRGHQEPWQARLFAAAMRKPAWRRYLQRFMLFSQTIGLTKLARRIGPASLRRMLEFAPTVGKPRQWRDSYMPRREPRGQVSLFLGCVADMTQPQVTAAAIAVLNAMALEVRIPPAQGCCGALDQHAGRGAEAAKLARNNLLAFDGDSRILGTASGCHATLMDYPLILGEEALAFAYRVEDVSSFIARHARFARIQFEPWKARVLVHQPCTLRNVLKTEKTVMGALKRIPEIKLKSLPASLGCCGAAGSYMLSQAEQADAFAAQIASAAVAEKPDVLVTSNIGCSLHLAAALKRRGMEIPVMHPLEVLAKQLPESLYRPGL